MSSSAIVGTWPANQAEVSTMSGSYQPVTIEVGEQEIEDGFDRAIHFKAPRQPAGREVEAQRSIVVVVKARTPQCGRVEHGAAQQQEPVAIAPVRQDGLELYRLFGRREIDARSGYAQRVLAAEQEGRANPIKGAPSTFGV